MEGPLPKELLGLIPKVNAPDPDPPKSCCENVPLDAESWSSFPFSSLPDGPAPKDVDCKAESKGPPTLKKFAVSPILSKDWLKREKEGAISIELVGCGTPGPLFGLLCGSKNKLESVAL